MSKITDGKKYCYRYYDGNDSEGRPTVTMHKRVIIRETEKTFWHVEDMPYMTFEQLVHEDGRPHPGKRARMRH